MASPISVTLTMIDTLAADRQRVERTIHISNITVPCHAWECDRIPSDDPTIRAQLNRWIVERANEQHETVLALESYQINYV